jgi:hypothetical protein
MSARVISVRFDPMAWNNEPEGTNVYLTVVSNSPSEPEFSIRAVRERVEEAMPVRPMIGE